MNRLSPVVLQLIGVVLLVSSALFWAITDRSNVELVSASLTLITLGEVWKAQEQTQRETRGYRLPGDKDEDDEDDDEPARRARSKPRRVTR